MNSDVNLPHESDNQHRITQVRNRRRKNGILQYNVVYSFGSTEKGKWISLEDLQNADPETMSLISQYDEIHPFRKYQASHQKGKKVTEIIGIVSDNKEPKYVVKIEGSDFLEAVHSSYLYKYYKALLLDFFESKLVFKPSQTQIMNSSNEVLQQPMPQQVQTNISIPNSSPSSSQFNLLQPFTQSVSNGQNDQIQIDQKIPKPPKQKKSQYQPFQQQQFLQMMQQMQVSPHPLMNGQMAQFSQQNQPIQQMQQQIQLKQKKTPRKSQKMQNSQQQQPTQVFYPQNLPVQPNFALQSPPNMMIGQMGSMINFQNVQQVPHQAQGNQ